MSFKILKYDFSPAFIVKFNSIKYQLFSQQTFKNNVKKQNNAMQLSSNMSLFFYKSFLQNWHLPISFVTSIKVFC